VVEVLHAGVRAGKEQGLVTTVAPPDDIGRPTIGTAHLEHLAVAVGFPDAMTLDYDAITHTGTHAVLLFVRELILCADSGRR
jgi:hypothetical protein